MDSSTSELRDAVRNIPDFPQPGILFRDITPILSDPRLFRMAIEKFVKGCAGKGIEKVAAIDARGFIFGAVVAHEMNVGFIPIRKRGKLPYKTVSSTYQLEYGSAEIEMHNDAVRPGERIVLIDDLLATGGTSAAALQLIRSLKGEVTHVHFLIELEALKGRECLAPIPVVSILKF